MNKNKKEITCKHCGTDIDHKAECCDSNPHLCDSCESKADKFISNAFKEGLTYPHFEDDSEDLTNNQK